MIQAFSLIFNFFNLASLCSDMVIIILEHFGEDTHGGTAHGHVSKL
jgi:hypothetical protein